MAKQDEKWPDNRPGAYYVDQECIDCDTCRGIAPDFFIRNDDDAHSYVYLQPVTPDDIELCEEALDLCPTQAIGSDGDEIDTEVKPSNETLALSIEGEVKG